MALFPSSQAESAPAHSRPEHPVPTSLIIISYNSRPYLADCLTAVLQTVGPDCQIIVVDNASEDGSADFVAEQFPTIGLVRLSHNLGFAAANNLAVRHWAGGEVLVFLNPDTVVRPGWLKALIEPLEATDPLRHEKAREPVGLTTPRILLTSNPTRLNACGNTPHFTGLTVCRGLGQPSDSPVGNQPALVGAVSGACFAIRRELWQTLGGLDETFFTYLEDTDLSWRASLAGYTCRYVPEAVVCHDYASRFAAGKFFFLERNRWLLLFKNLRPQTLFWLWPALLLTELITTGYTLKAGPSYVAAKWKAYVWLARHRAWIVSRHEAVQQLRQVDDATLLAGLDWRLDISQLAGPRLGRWADCILNPLYHLFYRLARRMSRD